MAKMAIQFSGILLQKVDKIATFLIISELTDYYKDVYGYA
jgi:hypothetical protein